MNGGWDGCLVTCVLGRDSKDDEHDMDTDRVSGSCWVTVLCQGISSRALVRLRTV